MPPMAAVVTHPRPLINQRIAGFPDFPANSIKVYSVSFRKAPLNC